MSRMPLSALAALMAVGALSGGVPSDPNAPPMPRPHDPTRANDRARRPRGPLNRTREQERRRRQMERGIIKANATPTTAKEPSR